jgi:hypothetical protein
MRLRTTALVVGLGLLAAGAAEARIVRLAGRMEQAKGVYVEVRAAVDTESGTFTCCFVVRGPPGCAACICDPVQPGCNADFAFELPHALPERATPLRGTVRLSDAQAAELAAGKGSVIVRTSTGERVRLPLRPAS